ncbi:MAG: Hpt domain-containing protein [Maricaulaceae bacterium]|nr:Hpt domain-containing protein [Maricaulaceae bacterium]
MDISADTPAPAILDRTHLARYTGGDAALEAELLALLKQSAARSLAAMEHAASDQAWRDAAHTLKGAARGVGAFALAEACERAEEAGPAWRGAALAEVRRASDAVLAVSG